MPDGGFRPAYDIQFATDMSSGTILGVSVINHGTDQGQAFPMAEQVDRRVGRQPESYLNGRRSCGLNGYPDVGRSRNRSIRSAQRDPEHRCVKELW